MASAPPPYPGDLHTPPEDDKTHPPPPAYHPPSAHHAPSACAPPSACDAGQQSGARVAPTVVVQQPAHVQVQVLQDSSVRMLCQYCRADVMTATEFEAGNLAWISCMLLCCLGCNLGCCLIPFAVDNCKDVVHFCPNCRQQVGRYHRM